MSKSPAQDIRKTILTRLQAMDWSRYDLACRLRGKVPATTCYEFLAGKSSLNSDHLPHLLAILDLRLSVRKRPLIRRAGHPMAEPTLRKPKLASPFPWYGGKRYLVPKLLPLLPAHRVYCEVFGGSGALLFAKPPSPVEVFNDLDGDVVNFFRVLRDRQSAVELRRRLQLTPYARAEHLACEPSVRVPRDKVERARRFFVRARQGFGSVPKGTWGYGLDQSRAGAFRSAVSRLDLVTERLAAVQIEGDDFEAVIGRWDSDTTLFFLDPPYLPAARKDGREVYSKEMNAAQHERLLRTLRRIEGMAVLSAYHHPLYDRVLDGWERREFRMRYPGVLKNGTLGGFRTEVVWLNPAVSRRVDALCGEALKSHRRRRG